MRTQLLPTSAAALPDVDVEAAGAPSPAGGLWLFAGFTLSFVVTDLLHLALRLLAHLGAPLSSSTVAQLHGGVWMGSAGLGGILVVLGLRRMQAPGALVVAAVVRGGLSLLLATAFALRLMAFSKLVLVLVGAALADTLLVLGATGFLVARARQEHPDQGGSLWKGVLACYFASLLLTGMYWLVPGVAPLGTVDVLRIAASVAFTLSFGGLVLTARSSGPLHL